MSDVNVMLWIYLWA